MTFQEAKSFRRNLSVGETKVVGGFTVTRESTMVYIVNGTRVVGADSLQVKLMTTR